jgi:hypothetical protein
MSTNFIRQFKKLKYFSRLLQNYSRMNTAMNTNDEVPTAVAPKKLKTEDTGKIFEKAICDAYGIPYDGPFQYSQADVDKLTPRLKRLVTDNMFPMCKHTASKGARYDFTAVAGVSGGEVLHLSAKSNKKKGGKVAPQVVGQATPQKFWGEFLQFSNGSNESSSSLAPDPTTMKKYIQENIAAIMPMLWRYTFDSPMVYYVRDTNTIRFIAPAADIMGDKEPEWASFQYSWSRPYDKWSNSTTLRIVAPPGEGVGGSDVGGVGGVGGGGKEETIMEFQFHTKSRQNMAIRWCIDKVLEMFAGHFKVTEL